MKKIKIDLKLCFGNSIELSEYLKSIDYLDYYKLGGVYLIHNKKYNKYYIGSTTVTYLYRISARGTAHNTYYQHGTHPFVNKDNIDEFELIILPNSTKYDIRKFETKLIRLLKTYDSKYGYNHTINGQRREDLKGQKCKWVTNGIVDSFILQSDTIPEGWRHGRTNHGLWNNKARLNSFQITNGKIDSSCRSLILPEGFYPGRFGTSYCKMFFDAYGDPSLPERNKQIETIELLKIKVTRKFIIDKLNKPVWEFNMHSRIPLKRFYNIEIIIE